MIRYYKSIKQGGIVKVQGEGAFIYSPLTNMFERCNDMNAEILKDKDDFVEISYEEVRRYIHKHQGVDRPLLRDNMKLHKVIAFSCVAHEGQYRKGTKIPYIVHPFEVAQILSEAGADEDVICAGLLHDIIEDTNYTGEDLEAMFGRRVRMLVEGCTQECEGSWEERKQHYIDYLEQKATLDSMMISCADKLANLRSTKENYLLEGERVWDRFNRGKEAHRWYFSKLIDAFNPYLNNYDMFWELNTIYKELFVSHYRKGDCLYQTNGPETHYYKKGSNAWVLYEGATPDWNDGYQKIDEVEEKKIIAKWELNLD